MNPCRQCGTAPPGSRSFCSMECYSLWETRHARRARKAKREWTRTERGQDTRLKYKYGISLADRQAMERAQGGCCKLCGVGAKLCVDHDHATGRVRGLLCNDCNTALGKLGDCPETLELCLRYVKGEL